MIATAANSLTALWAVAQHEHAIATLPLHYRLAAQAHAWLA